MNDTEAEVKALRDGLAAAKARNPDAYTIIGAVSGFGEKKVRDIANGKYEPDTCELSTLCALAGE